jgi:hypothetical protein
VFALSLSLLLLQPADEPPDALAKRMLPIYARDAADYSLAVVSAPERPLELRKEPVFDWSNPVRSGLQQGVVFLWLRDGRPAALGCIFSQPDPKYPGGRRVFHEFHALDAERLVVTRAAGALNEWKPQAGLERQELPDAGTPAATPGARLVQMRRLAQEFSGHEIDAEAKPERKWDLRFLPAPLYRYPEAKTGVVDGAVFTLVSTAGTDPEVLLLIEAREVGGKLRWEYALGRFSDRSLYVNRKDREVWTSVLSATNTRKHDLLFLYQAYGDKIVDLDGKLLARIRVTEKNTFGEVVPVTDR